MQEYIKPKVYLTKSKIIHGINKLSVQVKRNSSHKKALFKDFEHDNLKFLKLIRKNMKIM